MGFYEVYHCMAFKWVMWSDGVACGLCRGLLGIVGIHCSCVV